MEMIELFVQNVPNDVALLKKAIFKQDVKKMKKMAHLYIPMNEVLRQFW